ncbi:putative WD repeat-containing protein 11 isoform X1 [Trypanosoma theileri]|uniref:Putative WD repeat-containing protein 11 isoform X1 n=1 Tax=Trypanosoma theileri TaxID=67003 RepID=A0A1X0PAE1_9TRYP|nr:putative WD repeat-containing protein 11 isoform X1 [Trypanosoma theileri]ORC93791.1 putative WD repeat-containing protein 11 isoform X1 [Trypanosoma theileri]
MSPILSTKIIPGKTATPGGNNAPIDEVGKWPYQAAQYGYQDLLAYSSYCNGSGDVFVVDMNSMQLVQTLHGHNYVVTCIQWKPPPASYLQHGLFLFTGDNGGFIALWDVSEGVILNSLQVPNAEPIHALSLPTKHHLLVLTKNCSSFLYDSHLAGKEPFQDVKPPFRSERTNNIIPLHLCSSKLCPTQTYCVVFGDRIRILASLELTITKKSTDSWVKDLIYDSQDGNETVFDATFSEAQEEVLYFATRNSVGAYDWKTNLVLNEQVLWHTKSDVEFRRIFPSSPNTIDECSQQIPFLYSFGTDQRLCAWYVHRIDKVTNVAIDVRGARIGSKSVANVVQSQNNSNLFSIIFTDGSVTRWRFRIESRRWSLEGYLSFDLTKPMDFCLVGQSIVCCALENGHLVMIDVMHNVTLRRVNIVHSGGTRIILLSPHKWGESVWVVTNKSTQSHHFHQVTLFDCRSGVVLSVLRKPTNPDVSRMKGISLSETGNFLLLTFFNGSFEVWSVEGGGLIYFFEGMGIAGVSWAPMPFLSCLTGVQGSPQLLTIVFTDGTMSLWTVYKDRVVQNRDVVPIFFNNYPSKVVCEPTNEMIVICDGIGIPVLVSSGSWGFRVLSLKNTPVNKAALSIAVSKIIEGDENDNKIHNSVESSSSSSADVLLAALFTDGSFGVWNTSNQERISYSEISRLNLSARVLAWMGDALLVLTSNGDLVLLDKLLTSVNSSISCKSPRRPIQSSAFFLPAHRTYIQTSLETQIMTNRSTTSYQQNNNLPSYLVQSIDIQRRPCRGPLGQVITESISTLSKELDLYKETMIPKYILSFIQKAIDKKCNEELALYVARFFGQKEKERFWSQYCMRKTIWHINSDVSDPSQCSERRKFGREQESPFFYIHCNYFSEAVASSEVVRRNRMLFNEHRISALEARKNENIDASNCRLVVARELLRLQEPQKAIDILMDTNYESEQFPNLANLAVTIAASSAAIDATSSTLFNITTKRAAALFLARGDLDSAVEKFILSSDYYGAGLALQSCGKWSESARLAKVSAISYEEQKELLYRWCSHSAKRGEMIEAARVLLSISCLPEALVLLSESQHLTDIAGLFAMILLEDPSFSSKETLQMLITSPTKDEDSSDALRFSEVLLNTLTDYCNVLNSVGNVIVEHMGLEVIAALKRGNRNVSPSFSTI